MRRRGGTARYHGKGSEAVFAPLVEGEGDHPPGYLANSIFGFIFKQEKDEHAARLFLVKGAKKHPTKRTKTQLAFVQTVDLSCGGLFFYKGGNRMYLL